MGNLGKPTYPTSNQSQANQETSKPSVTTTDAYQSSTAQPVSTTIANKSVNPQTPSEPSFATEPTSTTTSTSATEVANNNEKNATSQTTQSTTSFSMNSTNQLESTANSQEINSETPNSNQISMNQVKVTQPEQNATTNQPQVANITTNLAANAPTPAAIQTGTWGTAQYTYDDATKTLTLLGGGQIATGDRATKTSTIPFKDVQHIIFNGKVGITKEPNSIGVASYVFAGLKNLEDITNISNLDVSDVTNMTGMFADDTALKTLDLSGWDVSKVGTDLDSWRGAFGAMFANCSSLTSVNFAGWNTANATYFNNMFDGATSLTHLDISMFNTRKTDFSNNGMTNMFNNMPNLWEIKLGADTILSSDAGLVNPTTGQTIPGTTKKVAGPSWQLVGTGSELNPQGAWIPAEGLLDGQPHPYEYVWAQTVNTHVIYVDNDNNNVQVGTTNDLGYLDLGTDITNQIKTGIPSGYELTNPNLIYKIGEGSPIDSNGNQLFTIGLKHIIKTITPDNPGVPGQPIDPSDPNSPKWPEKTTAEDLKTESTITVHYKYADGRQAAPDATRTVHFTRTATVDAVTGQVTYGDWTPVESTNVTVDSPAISGYTPDQGQISVTATAGQNNDQTVTYQANDVKATVKVIDDTTGQTIETHPLTGKTGEQLTNPVDLQALKNKGYVIGNNNVPTTFGPDAEQTYEIHVTHDLVTGTPDKPGNPGQPIDPNNPDGPKWPEKTAAEDLESESTITVHYKYDDGRQAAPDSTRTVKFTRTVTVDMVTGQVTYSDWTPVDSPDVTIASPTIDGYTPDQAQVSMTATLGQNRDQTVTYTQNPLIVQPIDKNGTPVGPAYPTDPKHPEAPTIPGYTFNHFETKDGKTFAVYTKDDTPVTKDDQITIQPIDEQGNPVGPAYPTDPKHPQAPTIPGYQFIEFQTKAGQTFAVYAKVASQPTKAAQPQTQLPQTGQSQNHFLGFLGMLLTTLAGLFGFGKLQKRQ
ncbi:BspA family leucine-rich repeat surface protein [Fructilactobacillus ixorae]|uniref:BspA family leucine-rich repeat surface protein n=1 Tax=Fructilactobacillus ixorae TaxID=1750535 RepID=A0ABY5C3I9_9LACO|nr:BspA family leucine-rich repeat surface protein [Fructilactobacillus ixorae]USS93349.1 BspA family leucine-rich repeat surface protein [Fructilactobacillus ixorae]